jgi:hypothetical protein
MRMFESIVKHGGLLDGLVAILPPRTRFADELLRPTGIRFSSILLPVFDLCQDR